ncbi:hypothetical protein [Actinokineospora globicatena]|uniref:hypothetical protein n=1 Tax=Actinokineospora globicatena TaxID=103729 RepID=UPI0020A3E855|nr:hypothetical protein [Actinokineospora globicatena]MCP2306898.1 hypothetical protein [Actinokineospora globicatena]GLW82341.1 hypothetical protein Aglo01_68220 [Actinokineospora globicatena]GLW89066.1 hypothetical protein Aglo02_67050 [Actinokineospora globicatena]
MADNRTGLREHRTFIIITVAAFAAAAAVWVGFPHQKSIPNLWVLLAKLVPFILAVEAIAAMRFSLGLRHKIARVAVPLCFLVFFTYFVPSIFFAAANDKSIYYLILTLTPFLILALTLSHRLGGGTPGGARRLGYAMIVLQLSGLEDLAFLTINPHTDPAWTPIPEVWTWADHMTVRLGHPASKYEAFTLIAVHVIVAVLILTLPDRVWRKLARRDKAETPVSDTTATQPTAESTGTESTGVTESTTGSVTPAKG